MKNKLSKKELQEIKGAETFCPEAIGDTRNVNSVNGCLCLFNDTSAISNENSVIGCRCSCKNPN